MLSSKVLYDELKSLIIKEYELKFFPKSKKTKEEEDKELLELKIMQTKIGLLEKILELK